MSSFVLGCALSSPLSCVIVHAHTHLPAAETKTEEHTPTFSILSVAAQHQYPGLSNSLSGRLDLPFNNTHPFGSKCCTYKTKQGFMHEIYLACFHSTVFRWYSACIIICKCIIWLCTISAYGIKEHKLYYLFTRVLSFIIKEELHAFFE